MRHAGTKVGFSNLGPGARIGALGGNCVNLTRTPPTPCVFSITGATNSGTTTPGASTHTDHGELQRRHQLLRAAGRRSPPR